MEPELAEQLRRWRTGEDQPPRAWGAVPDWSKLAATIQVDERELWWRGSKCDLCEYEASFFQAETGYRCDIHKLTKKDPDPSDKCYNFDCQHRRDIHDTEEGKKFCYATSLGKPCSCDNFRETEDAEADQRRRQKDPWKATPPAKKEPSPKQEHKPVPKKEGIENWF